jgi:hypothetical protein
MTDELDELAAKMHVLEDFVRRLRENPANQNNLAAAVERILQIGSSDEISQAFKMCEEKFKEV